MLEAKKKETEQSQMHTYCVRSLPVCEFPFTYLETNYQKWMLKLSNEVLHLV